MKLSDAFSLFRALRSTSPLLAVLVVGCTVLPLTGFAGDPFSTPHPFLLVAQQSTNPKTSTPLIEAVKASDVAKVKKLLDEGASVDAIDDNTGATALIVAVLAGNIDIAKMILSHGANPNTQIKDGLSSLWIAASVGREDLVRLLLNNGADPNQKSRFGSPEIVALSNGHLRVVAALQEHGGVGSNIKVKMGPTTFEFVGDDPSNIVSDYMLVSLFVLNPQPSRALADLALPVIERHELAGAKRSSTVPPTGFEMVLVGSGDMALKFGPSWADPLAGVLSSRGDFPPMAFRAGSAQPTRRDGQLAIEIESGTELRIGARAWRYAGGKWVLQRPWPMRHSSGLTPRCTRRLRPEDALRGRG